MELKVRNFKKLFENKLFSGSLVMMVGTLVAGFGNYLYHLLMGRMLGPIEYGVLASIISIAYLLSIPLMTLNLVVVKFISALKEKKGLARISFLYRVMVKKGALAGLLLFLIFLGLTPGLVSFLHLQSTLPLVLIGIFIFFAFNLIINRATLQGLLRFGYLSVSSVLEIILKLVLAVWLVSRGFKVNGALLAVIIGGAASYFFTFFPLKPLFLAKAKKLHFDGREMINFAIPVFFSTAAFTSLYTSDVVLARHFLKAQQAGFYAALAVLGKIIYFVASPIILVMFPMISERYTNAKKYSSVLLLSLAFVGVICLGITGIYFLFPKLMVGILFGQSYLPAASFLGLFGIFLSFYSFCFLLVNFFLSTNRTKVVVLPLTAAILQIILISVFHQNLGQIIWLSVMVTALLLFSLLLYYFRNGV